MTKSFFIFIIFTAAFFTSSAQTNEQYIVAAPTASMRSGQGTDYALLATVNKNDIVRVSKVSTNRWWLVDFKGTQGFILAKFLKKRSSDGWISTKYESGATLTCDGDAAEYDFNLDNHLRVTTNTDSDLVLKLMKKQANGSRCIRTVYIESNDFILIKNIPEGKYYLKLAYGKDWRQKKMGEKCEGRFIENATYELGKQQLNYKIVQLSNRIDIPSYALVLGNKAKEGVEATFNTNQISEVEFNN
jgi:hypothetical protein